MSYCLNPNCPKPQNQPGTAFCFSCHYSNPSNGQVWQEDDVDSRRVIRGGCWRNQPYNCRSACRNVVAPDKDYEGFGFRVALKKL